MTLGNMRQNGMRGLFVTCSTCGYHTEVNVDAWPDDVPVCRPAHAVYQVRASQGYRETESDRAAGLLAGPRP